MLSVENQNFQKGVNAVQRYSIENQKGALAVSGVYGDNALLVLDEISLNSIIPFWLTIKDIKLWLL